MGVSSRTSFGSDLNRILVMSPFPLGVKSERTFGQLDLGGGGGGGGCRVEDEGSLGLFLLLPVQVMLADSGSRVALGF